MEPNSTAKLSRLYLIAIIAIAGVTFFFGLGRLALISPDEPRYAEVAREMFVSGDYVSTRLCGCLWFEKPALLYWLSAASYRLVGVSEFGARLPSAVAALGTVALLYAWLRKSGSQRFAFAASVVLASSGIFVAYARVATPDMLLTASMALAFAGAFPATTGGRRRILCWLVFGFGVGLALLAKGLVGIVITPLVVVLFVLVRGTWRRIGWRGPACALITCAAVASVWYVPAIAKHGRQFLVEFFLKHHYERYVSNYYGHPQPFYFFVVIAFLGALPWSLFLAPAAARLRSLRPNEDASHALVLFAWIWVVVPILFFSFSRSKLPGYILPVFPALAIIIGLEVERFWSGEHGMLMRATAWGTSLAILALSVGAFLYVRREVMALSGWRLGACLIPVVLASSAAVCLAARRRVLFLSGVVATMSAMVVGAVLVLFGPLDARTSIKPLSLEVADLLRPGERICFFVTKEFAPVFYDRGRVVCGLEGMDVLNALREPILQGALEREEESGSRSLIVITTSNWRTGLETYPAFETELVARQGEALAFRVSLRR